LIGAKRIYLNHDLGFKDDHDFYSSMNVRKSSHHKNHGSKIFANITHA